MDVQDDGRYKEKAKGGQQALDPSAAFPDGPQQLPADQIQVQHHQDDGQVHQHHGAQRIQELAVGIQQRRKQLRLLGDMAPVEIHPAQQTALDEEGNSQPEGGGMQGKEQQAAGDEEGDGQPQQGRMAGREFRNALFRKLEQRLPVHQHGHAHAGGKWLDGIKVSREQMPVDAIDAPGLHFVDDLQTGYDTDLPVIDALEQEPLGPQVHIGEVLRHVLQGGGRFAAGISQALDQGALPDIVAADGELVGPALQGVAYVAVDYHVFRQPVQLHPFRPVL